MDSANAPHRGGDDDDDDDDGEFEEARWLLFEAPPSAGVSLASKKGMRAQSSSGEPRSASSVHPASLERSGRHSEKSGSKKCWMIAGAVLACVFVIFVLSTRFSPSTDSDESYASVFWKKVKGGDQDRDQRVGFPTLAPHSTIRTTAAPTSVPEKGKHECSAREHDDVILVPRLNASRFSDVRAVRLSILRDALCVRVHFVVVENEKLKSYDEPCPASAPRFAVAYKSSKSGEGKEADVAVAVHAGCYAHKDDLRPFHHYVAVLAPLDADAAYAYSIHQIVVNSKQVGDILRSHRSHRVDKSQGRVYVTHPTNPSQHASLKRLGKPAQKPPASTKYLVIGDMDTEHFGSVVDSVLGKNKDGQFSMFLQLGDASYASNSGECYSGKGPGCRWDCPFSDPDCLGRDRAKEAQMEKWANWWYRMESITSSVVTMTTPGNHDNDVGWFYSFHPPVFPWFPQRYDAKRGAVDKVRERLLGMNTRDQQAFVNDFMAKDMEFYSFDYGLVHFVSMSTEDNPINAYEKKATSGKNMEVKNEERFRQHFGKSSPQYQFIKNDLMNVDRNKTPWVVVFTHRPLYHSSDHHPNCDQGGDWFGCSVRETYDPMFADAGVNLVLSGHSHHYQRSSPIVRGDALDESAPGPRYMVCGVGGFDLVNGFANPKPPWVKVRTGEHYGHCMFDVHNATAMHWKFFAAETGDVYDDTWIIQ